MTESSPRLRIAHVMLRLFTRGATSPADAWRHMPGVEVDKRRVADDLKMLAEAGVVELRGEGRERRYALPTRYLQAHRGLLDRLALAIGHDHVRFLDGTALASPIEREEVTPSSAAPRVADRLDRLFHFIGEPERSFSDHEEALDTVVDGLVRGRCLHLAYGEGPHARVYPAAEPLTLVVYRRSLYLLVREPTLPEARCLAVDRIREARLGEPFDYPADWSPQEHFRHVFGVTVTGEPEPVVLEFAAQVAHLVQARRWHPTQRIDTLADGRVRLTMKATGSELVRFVLEWGRQCRVVKPAWLREAVVAELRGALEGYGQE